MIEQIIAREQLQGAGRQFYFFRTYAGAEIDLIVDRGSKRIGYEFKCAVSAGPKDWANLKKGMGDGIIHKGFLVYLGERDYPVSEKIEIVGAERFLVSCSSSTYPLKYPVPRSRQVPFRPVGRDVFYLHQFNSRACFNEITLLCGFRYRSASYLQPRCN